MSEEKKEAVEETVSETPAKEAVPKTLKLAIKAHPVTDIHSNSDVGWIVVGTWPNWFVSIKDPTLCTPILDLK